jgi:arylsulfatase A-like enzyme
VKPNVIFILTDQQRWDSCGVHGNPENLTPNLDWLARHGTHLNYCFTPQPLCGPARACIQTGTHAMTNGSWRNGIPLTSQLPSLAQCFGGAGYETGYVGKWHLGTSDPVPPAQRGGYDYWLAAHTLEFSSNAYDCAVWNTEGERVKLPGYRVDALTDAAIRYFTSPRERPYFLFLSFLEPHHQNHNDSYPAPRGHAEKYADPWTPPDLRSLGGSTAQHIGGYYGMIERIDQSLGRIVDALHSSGQEANTIVAFTSDHGCHFKTRNAEYKRSCHESSIRVPGVLYGPGFEGGGTRRELFSLIDFAPTLLDAAGVEVPASMQGRSLVPRLRQRDVEDWRNEIFGQTSEMETGRYIRTDRWKYAVVAGGVDPNEVPASDCYEEAFLYDLDCDPYELNNLVAIPAYRSVREELRTRLLDWIEKIEGTVPEIQENSSTGSGLAVSDHLKPHSGTHPRGAYAPPDWQ